MPLYKKRQSKRLSLHKKHKIEKKVREHRRKVRREGTAAGNAKALRKDPGIPNMHPYKEKLMAQMERRKEKQEEIKEKQKLQRKNQMMSKRGHDLASMVRDAERRQARFEAKEEEDKAATTNTNQRTFLKELKKVIDASDVILEVLDARDPLGCRSLAIERLIMERGDKKIVFLLNKIDLVPREIVQQWLTYLRGFHPTIAFKASTQSQRSHLGQSNVDPELAPEGLLQSSECLGATTLISLLKNYCRDAQIKTGITVGIIGYPNVGKSSVINSLKRTKVATVGSTPGVTKTMQEVHLDKLVRLLDCPGIVFNTSGDGLEAVLRNAVNVESLEDPIEPVAAILQRCKKEQLMEKYTVPNFKDVQDFLFHVASKIGRLKKGGVPDSEAAARSVLRDWNEGRIPYFTVPPKTHTHVSAEVVTSYGKEFNMSAIAKEESTTLSTLPQQQDSYFAMAASAPRDDVFDEEMEYESGDSDDSDADSDEDSDNDDVERMEAVGMVDYEDDSDEDSDESGSGMEEDDGMVAQMQGPGKAHRGKLVQKMDTLMSAAEKASNPQTNQSRKKEQKQQKKMQTRAARTGPSTSTDMDGESYSLSNYYK